MSDQVNADRAEEQVSSESGLLLSSEPLGGTRRMSAADGDSDAADVSGDSDSGILGGDSDATDADTSDADASDADGTDAGDSTESESGLGGENPLGLNRERTQPPPTDSDGDDS